jgi:uncharacterized YccA/Bax inhibitor family protein
MTERFTVSMSEGGYEDMEADREERGLSRSAYVEQAVRKSVNRNTKIETIIEALTTAAAISFFMMVLSVLTMAWTYITASAAMNGQFIGAFGLFAASTLLVFLLPFVVEQLEEYETARLAKEVDA